MSTSTQVHGAESTMKVGQSGTSAYKSLLAFDVSDVPAGATVESATLTLTVVQGSTAAEIARVTGNWSEDTAETTTVPTAATPLTTVSMSGTVDIDLAPLVQDWVTGNSTNYGVAVRPPSGVFNLAEVATREAGANQPTLTITWTGGDTTPPAVTMTSPAFGDQVWGDVTLSADATDNIAVDRVEFTIGDTTIGTATTAPYSVTWDSTTVPDGDHLVTATAYDGAGNSASDAVGLRVANALDVTGQLDADFEDGTITAEEYVLNAVYAMVDDPALDSRYGGEVPEHPSMWLWRAMLLGDQLSDEAKHEVRAHLVPEITEQADTSGGVTTQSIGAVDCSSVEANLKSLASPLDCRVPAGSVDVWWNSDNPPPDGDANGIPDKVEAYGQGFIDAQGHFEAVLGYPPTGHVDALLVDPVIACGMSLPPMDFLLAGGQRTILLNHECGTPSFLAMHELFHQYQWDYLSPWGFASGAEAIKEISWWGEATAEWAAHQVLVANHADYNETADRFQYADPLPAFLNTAWQNIDDLGQKTPPRQYGAFVVAE